MQVNKQSFYNFLEGNGKVFVIPVYQRDYAWDIKNCDRLWSDIVLLNKKDSNNKSHFLGTIVNIYDKQDERLIVDGQQRLTTISLLLIALENYLKDKIDKTEDESRLQQELMDFLVNRHSSDKSKRIRLKPNKQDRIDFDKLFEDDFEVGNDSNIVNNYNFFYEKIENCELKPRELFDNFKKLEIVNIELERMYDDPQLIFESLNSTGVDLTDGDLIRNYILMGLEPREQEDLYEKYWVKIENKVGDIAEFLRNFLMFKLQKNVTQKKRAVYHEFKKYSKQSFGNNANDVLESVLQYAKIYSFFINRSTHPDAQINNSLTRLNNLRFTPAYPFLFDIFDLYSKDVLSKNTVNTIINLVESYVFRRIMVYNSTQGMNKMFLTLSREVKRLAPDNWQDRYFDVMSFIIKNKTTSQKFPTDSELREAMLVKNVYKLSSKNRDFLLSSLEGYGSSYSVDLTDLTVEHIMPQTLTNVWKKSIGIGWEDMHSEYVHTIGNLTLTAKNSKLSNNNFKIKQKIDLHTSKLKLSYKLGDINEWNKEVILQRTNSLVDEMIQIWKYPVTDFEKVVIKSEVYTLSEDLDLRNTKPVIIQIGDEGFKIAHWREIIEIICRKFYDESPTKFREFMRNSDLSRYFGFTGIGQYDYNDLREFRKGFFVDVHGSTTEKFRFIIKVCEHFDFDYSEIGFEVR